MSYVDGFVLPVPKNKLGQYRHMAQSAAKVWKKHGALEYFECVGDDLTPKLDWRVAQFPKMAKAKPNETVVFAFIIFKSKAHRDRVNAKVMKEFGTSSEANMSMPFDSKRMAYGGFKTLVEQRRA